MSTENICQPLFQESILEAFKKKKPTSPLSPPPKKPTKNPNQNNPTTALPTFPD